MKHIVKMTLGTCPCCKQKTVFIATTYWFRDYYRCSRCNSIPRQRALMYVLRQKFPGYKDLKIHESSPSGPTFKQLVKECKDYSFSYYFGEKYMQGERMSNGATNENLEDLTFENESLDLFITQDVMEHVNNPEKAFSEIARVLKRGGVHIFTTPIYHFQKTRARIKVENGQVVNVLPAIYHGNPISEKGSLVTYDWGYDIAEYIERSSGMKSEVIEFPQMKPNYRMGLDADFLEVIVSKKE